MPRQVKQEARPRIRKYHPALRRTTEAIRTARVYNGLLYTGGPGRVRLKIGIGEKARALRFLHDLFTAAEGRGWEIKPDKVQQWKPEHRRQELVISNGRTPAGSS